MLRGRKKPGSKCLPVSEPMITTYTQHAHLLAILTNYEETYPWIYSNYIQLYINRDYKYNWGDFYFSCPYELRPSDTCKWISSQKVRREIVDLKWKSIIDFIVDAINENIYIHTMINYIYVPISERYNKLNLNHDIFVYGYDLKKKLLYVSDFFKDGRYSFEQISFKDFSKAFTAYLSADNFDYLNHMIYLYSYNNQCDYKFNAGNITKSINAYLSGTAPEYWEMFNADNKVNIVFGVDVYSTLKNYITEKITEKMEDIDIRPFYMLYDHKKLMSLRLKYLHKEGYFNNDRIERNIAFMKEVEILTRNVVNIIYKYNITKDNISIGNITKILDDIKKQEYDILCQYTF